MTIKQVLVFLLCVFFMQCTRSSETGERSGNLAKVSHPNSLNLPDDDEAADVLLIGGDENLDEFRPVARHFEGLEELFSLGLLEGDSRQLFNRIEDMVVDSRGRLYLLDTRRYGVGVFSREGNYITTLGREGKGPGEFQNPQSLAIYRDSLLLISDRYRIEVFDITREAEYEHVESINLERETGNICILDDTIFAHSSQLRGQTPLNEQGGFNMIDAYSAETYEYQFSFGRSYQHSHPFVARRMTVGAICCNEASERVVFVFNNMPVIQGYTKEGSFAWVTRVDELFPPRITESNREGRLTLSYQRSEEGFIDVAHAPANVHKKLMVLQIQRGSSDPDNETKLFSFAIDGETGRGSYLSDDIPFTSAISSNILASRDYSLDYPVARIFELNGE